MLQIILAADTTIDRLNKQYKTQLDSIDAQIEQVKNQLKTADDKDDLKQQLGDLHKSKRDIVLERDEKRIAVRKRNNEHQAVTSAAMDEELKRQVDEAWSAVVGRTGKFVLNKMYPAVVKINGTTVKFGMLKASGAGPLRLATIRTMKMPGGVVGDVLQFYKLSAKGKLQEDGQKNLFALSDDARQRIVHDFASMFK